LIVLFANVRKIESKDMLAPDVSTCENRIEGRGEERKGRKVSLLDEGIERERMWDQEDALDWRERKSQK